MARRPKNLELGKDLMNENGPSGAPGLSVVIPVYNEEKTLATIVAKLKEIPQLREIIIVDDCSKDATPEIGQRLAAEDPRVQYIRQPKNGGKTEALKAGFALTTGEVVIVQDADLEYDPEDIPERH